MPEDNKKEKIYDAVMQLIKEGKNMKTIKVSEIADRAGIGKGSIYLYFASKDDVIVEAAKHFLNTWLKPFKEFVIEEDREFKQSVLEFLGIHLKLLEEYHEFFTPQKGPDYINVFNADTLPGTIEVVRKSRLEYLEILENLLKEGMRQKYISYVNRYSVNVTAESIMLIIKYLAFKDEFEGEIELSEEQCKDLIYDMILRVCR